MRPAPALPRAARQARRGTPGRRAAERAHAFSDDDLRDLTVLFHLAWIGFAAREDDAELAALERKGRGYERRRSGAGASSGSGAPAPRCCRCGVSWPSAARSSCRRRRIYHPIVPLVIDSDARAARAARPAAAASASPVPRTRARRSSAAREAHTRSLRRAARGMWPPEGSVSPEAVALYAAAGIALARHRRGQPVALARTPAGRTAARRALSPLSPRRRRSGVPRSRAVRSHRLRLHARRRARPAPRICSARATRRATQRRAPADEPALVRRVPRRREPVGELPRLGRAVPARALRRAARARRPALRRGDHRRAPRRAHRRAASCRALHSGSWIDSDFHIWIGDPVKNRAWESARARRARAASSAPSRAAPRRPPRIERGATSTCSPPRAPTGSGGSASRSHSRRGRASSIACSAPTSRRLARARRAARRRSWRAGRRRAARGAVAERARRRRPRRPSARDERRPAGFYAWHGAGRFECRAARRWPSTPLVARIHFGFDRERLYLRLDPADGRARRARRRALEVELAARAGGSASASLLDAARAGARRGGERRWRRARRGGPARDGAHHRARHALRRVWAPAPATAAARGAPLARRRWCWRATPPRARSRSACPTTDFEAENWSV